jgi:hypothetical protein
LMPKENFMSSRTNEVVSSMNARLRVRLHRLKHLR